MTTSVPIRSAHPRVPLTHRRTPFVRALEAYSRFRYGGVLEPGLVALHNRRVLRTLIKTESSAKRWNRLDPTLKALASMAAAAAIGCEWCLDYGYWESRNRGVPAAKLEHLPRWRDAEVYSDLERAVIGFAEAMSATPPTVSDGQVEDLRRWLDNSQIIELTAMVALENLRSRSNSAMGLTGQGFKDRCDPVRQAGVHER
jgi:AhpD family alkylhydroperoxidase